MSVVPISRLAPIVLAACAALLAACGKADGSAKPAAETAVVVATQRAALRPLPVSVEAVGQAEGSREVEIRSRVNGILEKRLYEEGAAVAAGTLLFEIDAAPYELAVLQARAALQQERVKKELGRDRDAAPGAARPGKGDPAARGRPGFVDAKQSTAMIAAAEARLKEASSTSRTPASARPSRA
jgi:membrane fusion protein (multidrug efflux system)